MTFGFLAITLLVGTGGFSYWLFSERLGEANDLKTAFQDRAELLQARVDELEISIPGTDRNSKRLQSLQDTAAHLTLFYRAGMSIALEVPESDEEFEAWKARYRAWSSNVSKVLVERLTAAYAYDFDMAERGPELFVGFNEEHSELRAFHSDRMKNLRETIRELELEVRQIAPINGTPEGSD